MKYYVATFCTTIIGEPTEQSLRTAILTQHPYLELLDIEKYVPDDAADQSQALMFYAEITKEEYDSFLDKQKEVWGYTADELNNDIARMQTDPEFRKKADDAFLEVFKKAK